MAGIMANSASVTMLSGDTSASNVWSGFVTGEQITLSTTPTGASYSWGQSLPQGSATARAGLDDTTAASPVFTPDVAGEYVLTCVVGGSTTYVLRVSVVAVAAVSALGALRLLPVADGSVPTPATGVTLYFSSTQDALAVKDDAGTVSTVDLTAVP